MRRLSPPRPSEPHSLQQTGELDRPPPSYGVSAEPEGLSLHSIIGVLRRRFWLVAAVAVGITAVVAYLAYNTAPIYRASAVVRLTNVPVALAGGLGDAATEQMQMAGGILSQIQILRSRSVAEMAVDSFALRLHSRTPAFSIGNLENLWVDGAAPADTIWLDFSAQGIHASSGESVLRADYGVPIEIGGVRFLVAQEPQVESAVLQVLSREAMVRRIAGRIEARARTGTDVIDVSFEDVDPRSAQRVVNGVAQSFQTINARNARQQTERRRAFIEEQLASADSLLAEAQGALTSFRSRMQVFSSRDRFASQQSTLMQLEVEREQISADRRSLSTVLEDLRQAQPRGAATEFRNIILSPGIGGNPVISQLYGQLVGYETEYEALTTGLWSSSPTNPDVERIRSLIASTEKKLIDALQSHIVALEGRIAAIDALHSRNASGFQQLSEMEAEEVRLVRQVETVRGLGDQLRSDLQKVRISEAVEAGQVEIVDLATRPSSPVGTPPQRKIMLGMIVGLLLGGGSAVLLEVMNTSIRRREEIESVLQLPALAVIPRFVPKAPIGLRLPLLGAGTAANGKVHAGDQNTENGNEGSLNGFPDARRGLEAYRTLRTNLIFSQSIHELRSLVVTSASPNEGKTTTAANLAITFAQQAMRVLLVDADLRRPSLCHIFSVRRTPGLTDCLVGRTTTMESIRPMSVEGLYLLTSGTLPPNPSELLGGERMRALIEEWSSSFDMIIIDSSPLLVAADAAILGTVSDGVLMVVRAGNTDRAAAQQALQQLATVGARVVGAVLNDPDAKTNKYGEYYSYYYAADYSAQSPREGHSA